MNDPGKAVFLSYAREDFTAAQRIADALRAFGVEVWLDQSELRGGDAWDRRIKQQIRDCALFVPVVSAHTQARREGYFRREWKLAVERLNDMAEGTTFLLPVCVDDTREREALVPEAFLAVQWIRLAHGEVSPALCERVCSLLGGSATTRGGRAASPAVQPAAQPPMDFAEAKSTKSIAVLAFENLSSDRENEYFSDGISEELLNVLAKIPRLKVTARTSAFFFKGKNAPISEIAQRLNVAYVVEGSVRKAGERVRITAQLISAADGFHVWSESYDRRLDDIFAVQDEIARTIVQALGPTLGASGAERPSTSSVEAEVRAAAKGGTRNAEAYRLFLQGRYFANQCSREALQRAVGYYQQALEVDPEFASGWAALARAHALFGMVLMNEYLSFDQCFEPARRAARRALSLEPELAEAYAALILVQTAYDFDWVGAEESVRHALRLAPANAVIATSSMILAFARGEAENAIALARRAVELDPVSPEAQMWLLFACLWARKYTEAETAARRVIELSPTAPWSFGGLGLVHFLQGRLDEALAAAEREHLEWTRLTAVALVRWRQGRHGESDAALHRLIEIGAGIAAYQVAWVYGDRGNADQAFAWLDRAFKQRDSGLICLKLDPFLRNLHGDPRWPAFLKKMRLDE